MDYKKTLNEKSNQIIIGSFIEPSINPDYWAFNLFALRRTGENSFEYFFASIISINITTDNYKIEATYLFSEEESLKSWWRHIIGFYESDIKNQIPEEFVFKVCPPPPFRKE